MSIADATASDGTPVDIERTIALTPAQAALVAEVVLANLSWRIDGDIDGQRLDGEPLRHPEQFTALRALLDDTERVLTPIAWGRPSHDVALTLPAGEWWHLANQILFRGTGPGCGGGGDEVGDLDARERREQLRIAEAGIAIVDQLEATR